MKRILFVDDEKNVLDGIRRMLHLLRDTWEMEFVTSGEAALQVCSERPFDVIVSDLRMPGMDGAQLLGRIRSDYPGIARIILSGYSEPALAAQAVPVAYRVLAKPCNAAELKETVQRVCTLQDVLRMPALRLLIGTLGELPTLSTTYMKLSDALGKEATSIATIAKIIEHDVGMAAKILQVVNSGFFGLSQRASSVGQAVSYLGMDLIKTLALQSETFRLFVPSVKIPTSFLTKMQQHSQRAAIIASTLPVTREIREVTVVAALLHDAGTLVLASTMADQFSLVLEEMERTKCSQAEAEEQILGISHAEIGAYLLGLWGINSIAVEAIAHHHHPSRISHTGMDCSLAVYLSNFLAHQLELHPNDVEGKEMNSGDQMELERLGLLDQFVALRSRAVEGLDSGA
jgi:HD-like signal output (HDOD) protein/CheY-like chemotaxis protein